MNSIRGNIEAAFTLIELLVVLVAIAIIAVLILPALFSYPERPVRIVCISQQKQIAIALVMWNEDHGGKFPSRVSVTNGGSRELITNQASSHFKPAANYLKLPKVFVCPTDKNKKTTDSFERFTDENLSYFVNTDAATNSPPEILTGDRHLKLNEKGVSPGLLLLSHQSTNVGWTAELHGKGSRGGNVAFTDGRVQWNTESNLAALIKDHGIFTNRLAVP